MATNWPSIGTQLANITEHGSLTAEYLKFMQEKIKTSNRIPIKRVQKILRVSIEYAEATQRQRKRSIESLAEEQSQQQNGINDKLTVLKNSRQRQ